MKKNILFLLIVLVGFACKNTTNFNNLPIVSYAKTIEPIIISNCTQSGCHGTAGGKESFSLLSYDDLIKHGEIISGNPEKSKLFRVITTYSQANVMPKEPYNKLTEQQIQYIYVWIGQGAKNN